MYAAVQEVWSTRQVEGQNTRVNLLKRQMYRRANFDLLRRRCFTVTMAGHATCARALFWGAHHHNRVWSRSQGNRILSWYRLATLTKLSPTKAQQLAALAETFPTTQDDPSRRVSLVMALWGRNHQRRQVSASRWDW